MPHADGWGADSGRETSLEDVVQQDAQVEAKPDSDVLGLIARLRDVVALRQEAGDLDGAQRMGVETKVTGA